MPTRNSVYQQKNIFKALFLRVLRLSTSTIEAVVSSLLSEAISPSVTLMSDRVETWGVWGVRRDLELAIRL